MRPLKITSSTLVNSLGCGTGATYTALQNMDSGLRKADNSQVQFDTWIGRVAELEDHPLEGKFIQFDCRNNRLAKLSLDTDNFRASVDKACDRFGTHRIGVILGTSTSGIASTEQAYQHRDKQSGTLPDSFDLLNTHNIHSLVTFCQQYLGTDGLGLTISTACSSSAKVFAAAARYIESGVCDAAVVGGVDSLCLTTLYGFHSLELTSTQPCRPWDLNRDGISIGESAGFVLLEKADDSSDVVFKSYGESSDAYHMSTPHPEGVGAAIAMQQALARAHLTANDIDYINLHGTATLSNDAAEDQAIAGIFGVETPCSSTKGWTGHTLGAAGITEAIISMLVLENDFLPANLNMADKDPALSANILTQNIHKSVDNVMSNSFGFGGSNCSLLFGR
jgi:3-oxoacyl-[acyl-carrier-protein] synthase-1